MEIGHRSGLDFMVSYRDEFRGTMTVKGDMRKERWSCQLKKLVRCANQELIFSLIQINDIGRT